MIEVISEAIESSEMVAAVNECHFSASTLLDLRNMLDSLLVDSRSLELDGPNTDLSESTETPETKLETSSVTQLEARSSYIRNAHLYETDDKGNIYKCDGNLIPGVEYYDNGGIFRTDEFGNIETIKEGYLSTYKERLDHVPVEGERGKWSGSPGESKFIPSPETERGKKAVERLPEYGIDSVEYQEALPNFSDCSVETVEIEMTEIRYGVNGNFEKADTKCAEKWNNEGFLGKLDWTAREVTRYRSEYNYTWHECADRKTCQMISRDIHDYFGHSGGICECKKASAKKAGGGFDA